MESTKARKQRSLARYNWFAMKMFLINRIVERERERYIEKRLAKLDEFAQPASLKIMEKTTFNLSVRILKGISADSFLPLKAFRRTRHPIDTLDKIAEHSAFSVLSKIDPLPAIKNLATLITPTPAPLRRLKLVRYKPERLMNKADSIAESAAEHCIELLQFPDLSEQIRPLFTLSSQKRSLQHADNEDFVLNQIAASAVGAPDFKSGFQFIRSPRNVLRSLMRYAYPSNDSSIPFSVTRGVTLSDSDDENLISRDAFLARDEYGHKLYYFDLSHLFGIIDNEQKAIEDRIINLEKENEEVARSLKRAERKKLKHESVEESCYFVDDFLKQGLLEFSAELCGLDLAVHDAVKFQSDFAKQNLALSVSLATFKNVNTLSPFLWGAANIKMHKFEGRGRKLPYDPMYNTFD